MKFLVGENPEDSIVDNEENTVAVEEDTGAAMKKRKRSREGDPKGSKQNKEAKSTKRKRSRRKKGRLLPLKGILGQYNCTVLLKWLKSQIC